MKKQCLICGNEFETILNGGSRKYCFDCSPSYSKGDNSGRAKTITAIRHAVKKELIKRKGGKCELCGYDKCIAALEFHHLDPYEKEFSLADKIKTLSNINLDEIFTEVEKCKLLCANCHREIHWFEN